MGSADSKVMKKECLSDESEDEACGSGIHSAIAKIPNEVKPRYKLGNKSKGVKFTNKPKSEVLKSTTTSESNIELENIKKQLEMFTMDREQELLSLQKSQSKLEGENKKLKNEVRFLHKRCKGLKTDKETAMDSMRRINERAQQYSSDVDQIKHNFKLYREAKESEVQNLLKVIRNLESKVRFLDPSLLNHNNVLKDEGKIDVWSSVEDTAHPLLMHLQQPSKTSSHNQYKKVLFNNKAIENNNDFNNCSISFKDFEVDSGIDRFNDKTYTDVGLTSFIRENMKSFTHLKKCFSNHISVYHISSSCHRQCLKGIGEDLTRLASSLDHLISFYHINTQSKDLNPMHLCYRIDGDFMVVFVVEDSLRHSVEELLSLNDRLHVFITTDVPSNSDSHTKHQRIFSLHKKANDSAHFYAPVIDLIQEEVCKNEGRYATEGLNLMGWDSVWIWQKQHDYLLWQNIEDVYMEGCGGGSVVSDDYLRWLDMYASKLTNHALASRPQPPLLVVESEEGGACEVLVRWMSEYMLLNYNKTVSDRPHLAPQPTTDAGRSPTLSKACFLHYFASLTSHHCDVFLAIKCLMFQLMEHLASPFFINMDCSQVLKEFPYWLEKASRIFEDGVILVIHHAHLIKDFEKHFDWLMDPLPTDLTIVISTTNKQCPPHWRPWPTVIIETLNQHNNNNGSNNNNDNNKNNDDNNNDNNKNNKNINHEENTQTINNDNNNNSRDSNNNNTNSKSNKPHQRCFIYEKLFRFSSKDDTLYHTYLHALQKLCTLEASQFMKEVEGIFDGDSLEISFEVDGAFVKKVLQLISLSARGLSHNELHQLLIIGTADEQENRNNNNNNNNNLIDNNDNSKNNDTNNKKNGDGSDNDKTEIENSFNGVENMNVLLSLNAVLNVLSSLNFIKYISGLHIVLNSQALNAIRSYLKLPQSEYLTFFNAMSKIRTSDNRRVDECINALKSSCSNKQLLSLISKPLVAVNLINRSLSNVLLALWSGLNVSFNDMATHYLTSLEGFEKDNGGNEDGGLCCFKSGPSWNCGEVYGVIGKFFLSCGLSNQASMLLQKCLEEHETRLDPDDPRIAYDLDLLSRLNEKMGRYSTAVSLHNQALEIYQGADNEYTLENDALWSVEEEDDVACDDVVSRASDRICRSRVNYQFLIACQYEALSNAYHKMGKMPTSKSYQKKASSIRLKSGKKVTFAKPVTYEYESKLGETKTDDDDEDRKETPKDS